MMEYNYINGIITEEQDTILSQCINNVSPSKYDYLTNVHTVFNT